uniref:Uncharacterized protein n=1 Tax=Rhizophora mucronata TaxID=61149 RepID=A0A2P2PUS7_RHIMU
MPTTNFFFRGVGFKGMVNVSLLTVLGCILKKGIITSVTINCICYDTKIDEKLYPIVTFTSNQTP